MRFYLIYENALFFLREICLFQICSEFHSRLYYRESIAEACIAVGTQLISCMGTGNKQNPTELKVTDISKTNTCPLARVMRRELKKRGISHLRVIYSEEEAMTPLEAVKSENGKAVPGSLAFVPSVAGLIAASEAVKHIISKEASENG